VIRSYATISALFFLLVSLCPSCVAQQSTSTEELYRHAQEALASGNLAEAQRVLEALAGANPDVAEIHANLGLIYFQQKSYSQAISQLRRALTLKPSLIKSEFVLAMSLSEVGRYGESLPGLEKCFRSADREMKRICGLQLMRTYTGISRDADAVITAVTLNKLYPEDPEILYHTGRVYGNEAYVVMERLHDKASGSIWMLQAQGEANESQRNYKSALEAFNHVLTIDPRRPGIHYRQGRVYLARFNDLHDPSDRDAAKKEFEAELEIDPSNGNAAYELGQMASEDNHLDEARKMFESVVERFPEFEQALVGLGGVYLHTQETTAAIKTLERATRVDPSDEVAWYRLSRAERTAGDGEAASKALDTFHSLHSSTNPVRNPAATDEVTPQTIEQGTQP
jgi:tetratricopeptide (TPR) repeat protein